MTTRTSASRLKKQELYRLACEIAASDLDVQAATAHLSMTERRWVVAAVSEERQAA